MGFDGEIGEYFKRAFLKLVSVQPEAAEAFWLRVVEGKPRTEVTALQGLKRPETVSERVHRAKKFLRNDLPDFEDFF